ncbi:MAG: hypothetical protein OHK0046_41670 [Anaerolineae bacterium]
MKSLNVKSVSDLIRERTQDLLGKRFSGSAAPDVIRISADEEPLGLLQEASSELPAVPVTGVVQPLPVEPLPSSDPPLPILPLAPSAEPQMAPQPILTPEADETEQDIIPRIDPLPMDTEGVVPEPEAVETVVNTPMIVPEPPRLDMRGLDVSAREFNYPPLRQLYTLLRQMLPPSDDTLTTAFTFLSIQPQTVGIGSVIAVQRDPDAWVVGERLAVEGRFQFWAAELAEVHTLTDQLTSRLLGERNTLRRQGILQFVVNRTTASQFHQESQRWMRSLDCTLLYEYRTIHQTHD